MSVEVYYTNNDGDLVQASNRVRVAALELHLQATELAVGESQIVVDDPDGDFYTPGQRPLYVMETEAVDDEFMGIIAVLWTWDRTSRRGPYRTGASREVVVAVKDMNTLATMRVQKGNDADRPAENDIERVVDWLINTTEVVGGFGSSGLSIDEREFVFEDSPTQMSETDYEGQDTAGVINDALQDTSKTAWLYNRAEPGTPIRVGLWYGHTDRSEFTSAHAISNDPDDVSPETLDAEWLLDPDVDDYTALTFAPSTDAELERSPSRQVTAALVQWDGGGTYVSQSNPPGSLTKRDMVFAAELVKNEAQATRRGNALIERLRNEDDAITCAVIVPAALVNGFHQGMRVPVRFTHFVPEGYAGDPVNMRIAGRTVRQLDAGLYEIALDLRGESQPFGSTPPGETPVYDSTIRCWLSKASGPYPLPTGSILWQGQPQLPWDLPVGPFTIVSSGVQGAEFAGIRIDADGILQHVAFRASCIGVALGSEEPYDITWSLTVNGVSIESVTEQVLVAGASNLYVRYMNLHAYDVAVSNGDIVAARISCVGSNGTAMEMFRVPHGIDPGGLAIHGGYFP